MTMPKLKEKEVFEKRLDFRPKCPIVRNRSGDIQNECGGERCAWWDTDNDHCVIHSIAHSLDKIRNTFATI